MKLRVLGCDGGRNADYNTTALLFNEHVLIDGGTILSALTVEEAARITHIFLTHSHLDHLVDLPFLMDNTFGMRDAPIKIYGNQETLDDLMAHVFNDKIWPDFSKLPTKENGQFTLHTLQSEEEVNVGDLTFTPILVNHLIPTFGYKVENEDASFVFSGDTAPTERVWEIANECKKLKAVVVDVSFPKSLQNIANLSFHLSTEDVKHELKKLKKDCDVYLFHFKAKPSVEEEMIREIDEVRHFGRQLKSLRDYKRLTF
jgi:ribonuclease BN (tRNA processing enzyme)